MPQILIPVDENDVPAARDRLSREVEQLELTAINPWFRLSRKGCLRCRVERAHHSASCNCNYPKAPGRVGGVKTFRPGCFLGRGDNDAHLRS